jgi:hypothetical protein
LFIEDSPLVDGTFCCHQEADYSGRHGLAFRKCEVIGRKRAFRIIGERIRGKKKGVPWDSSKVHQPNGQAFE